LSKGGIDVEKLINSKLEYKNGRITLNCMAQAIEDSIKLFTDIIMKKRTNELEEAR
jgi:hypothetical protein